MEGERRKRKKEKEEESEEEQMEKFFALIKNTRDARDRLSKDKEEEKAKGVWKPTFKAEDFVDDEELVRINVLHPPEAAGPSSGKEAKEGADRINQSPEETAPMPQNGNKKKASDDLDLSLSL